MSPAPRRPRRAVRPSGTVGSDETVLHTRLPSPPAGPSVPTRPSTAGPVTGRPVTAPPGTTRQGAPPGSVPSDEVTGSGAGVTGAVTAPGGAAAPVGGSLDDLWRTTRSADDCDRGWGREESSSNDERLRREKPPHW